LGAVFVHAAAAAATTLGTTAGHPSESFTLVDVDRELDMPTPSTAADPEPAPASAHAARPHTHPYPVPLDHARPHDPSLVHVADARLAEKEPAAPIALASTVLAPSDSPPVPTFTIALGNGAAYRASSASSAGPDPVESSPDEPLSELSVTTPARLVSVASPVYPAAARADGIEADVGLEIVVDAAGAVSEARLLRHAGYGFDAAALSAIRRYRFSPARRNGEPVRVRMRWTVQFRLR
jgi:TonB family protein